MARLDDATTKICTPILFAFEIVYWLIGVWLIVFGLIGTYYVAEYSHFSQGEVFVPCIALIIFGAITIILSTIGCASNVSENVSILLSYAMTLLIVIGLEALLGYLVHENKGNFYDSLAHNLKVSMYLYGESQTVTKHWDRLQRKFNCCGVSYATDWPELPPLTCCNISMKLATSVELTRCQLSVPHDGYLFVDGCYKYLLDVLDEMWHVVLIFALCIWAFQFLIFLVSMTIIFLINDDRDDSEESI